MLEAYQKFLFYLYMIIEAICGKIHRYIIQKLYDVTREDFSQTKIGKIT